MGNSKLFAAGVVTLAVCGIALTVPGLRSYEVGVMSYSADYEHSECVPFEPGVSPASMAGSTDKKVCMLNGYKGALPRRIMVAPGFQLGVTTRVSFTFTKSEHNHCRLDSNLAPFDTVYRLRSTSREKTGEYCIFNLRYLSRCEKETLGPDRGAMLCPRWWRG